MDKSQSDIVSYTTGVPQLNQAYALIPGLHIISSPNILVSQALAYKILADNENSLLDLANSHFTEYKASLIKHKLLVIDNLDFHQKCLTYLLKIKPSIVVTSQVFFPESYFDKSVSKGVESRWGASFYPYLSKLMKQHNICLIFCRETSSKDFEYLPGENGLRRVVESHLHLVKDIKREPTGELWFIKILKPFFKVPIKFHIDNSYETVSNDALNTLDYWLDTGIMTVQGSNYYLNDELVARGKQEFIKHFKDIKDFPQK